MRPSVEGARPYLRVLRFVSEVLGLVVRDPTLLNPIWLNIALTVPISLALAVLESGVTSGTTLHLVMAGGVVLLYFVDYFCNGMAVSLVHDEVTVGSASLGHAFTRTARAFPGILTFAAVSGALDLLNSYATNRRDAAAKLLANLISHLWTTAVYVLMPAMVIERQSFLQAFGRSKQLMKEDPTQVGVGVIGLGLVSWVLGIACMAGAYRGAELLGAAVHPLVGGMFFHIVFNLYWAVSGYLRAVYFTCFYLWARACETSRSSDPALAPKPLANTLAA